MDWGAAGRWKRRRCLLKAWMLGDTFWQMEQATGLFAMCFVSMCSRVGRAVWEFVHKIKKIHNFISAPPPPPPSENEPTRQTNTGFYSKRLLRRRLESHEKALIVDPDPSFQMVWDPTWIFSSIFSTNFTFVSQSCKCVRLHIKTMYRTTFF